MRVCATRELSVCMNARGRQCPHLLVQDIGNRRHLLVCGRAGEEKYHPSEDESWPYDRNDNEGVDIDTFEQWDPPPGCDRTEEMETVHSLREL